ncbi:MAG: kinase [Leptospiraceae bacterium]|nr:kinase [Leptospiraceae bacterium]
MIISRTPHRISFFGGGTDYPSYYLNHGGKVLGAAIDKYCYLNVRNLPPFFEHKHRIVYSILENVNDFSQIQHPSVRETLKYLHFGEGISIHHDGDIPARSGMGSSSAFTVGLIKSIYALNGQIISKDELTREAIHIEQNLIKENVGSQDQTFAAHGGLNLIEFLQNGEIVVNPVIMKMERFEQFESNFLLFFSGISRIASEVAKDQIQNTSKNESNLQTMKELVDESYAILTNPKRNLNDFGELLNHTWKLKKTLSNKISSPEIDEMYEKAMNSGALGGKLLGAGGGGFMVFYVEEKNKPKVIEGLKNHLHIPFKFDFEGSDIIVYKP